MKLLHIERNGHSYEFRFLERVGVMQITKNNTFHYEIRMFSGCKCTCPGSMYRGKCWHFNMLPSVINQPSLNAPWCEWAEDAGRMSYD